MKLTIELNKEQMNIIIRALEDYFRLRMGQYTHLSQSLADDTFHFADVDIEHRDREMTAYLHKRDALEAVYRSLITIAYGDYRTQSTDDCRNASDIWSVLRHVQYEQMYKKHSNEFVDVRSYEPIQLGALELIKATLEVDDDER